MPLYLNQRTAIRPISLMHFQALAQIYSKNQEQREIVKQLSQT